MTNSHNRSGRNGSYADRFFNNHSPQQLSGSGSKRNNATNSNGGNGGRTPKSPSSTYFRSISTSNAIPIVQQSTSPVSSKNGTYYNSTSPSGRHHSFNGQRSSPGGNGPFNNSTGSYPGSLSGSPPNFSHFAGSKCYDAPAPTALPKPPVHWTSPASSNVTISSALNTSKSSTNKPTSASIVNARSAYNSKGPSSVVSSAIITTSRSKVKSAVKPAMSCAAAAAKVNRRVDFTHNLKTALNVQA